MCAMPTWKSATALISPIRHILEVAEKYGLCAIYAHIRKILLFLDSWKHGEFDRTDQNHQMPVIVEEQNDSVQVCNFQHQKLGKNTAYLFHGEFRVCTWNPANLDIVGIWRNQRQILLVSYFLPSCLMPMDA